MNIRPLVATSLTLLMPACAREKQVQDLEQQAILEVKSYVDSELVELHSAAQQLQQGAPEAGPWGSPEAAPLKEPWKQARRSYERVEGAIAVLFPDLDAATDERYDGFLSEQPDDYLFDGEGVTGIHAIERILWSDSIPPEVLTFESAIPGYQAASFPSTEQEGVDFKNSLAARLVADTQSMEQDFQPLALDSAAAFRGIAGSMGEQIEKVDLAGSGEDESRYADHTLADMRANLEGARAVWGAFLPWLREQPEGPTLEGEVESAFDRVQAAYDAIPGESIPDVPSTWDPTEPSEANLASPYGQLWSVLVVEADPESAGSLVERLDAVATSLGIPVLPE